MCLSVILPGALVLTPNPKHLSLDWIELDRIGSDKLAVGVKECVNVCVHGARHPIQDVIPPHT